MKTRSLVPAFNGESGQATLIIAIGMVGLMGFLGLVTDLGWGFYQKRLAQNAADAAALAAIRPISQPDTNTNEGGDDTDSTCGDDADDATDLTAEVSALITTYVQLNVGATATSSYDFIDNTGSTVAACSATGVRVVVTAPYSNFFLQVVGISTSTTSATAAAHVRMLGTYGDVPFIVCGGSAGMGARRVGDAEGTWTDFLDSTTNPPSIDETYVGTEFWLHGVEVKNSCNMGDNFKGNADDVPAACANLPCDWPQDNGNRAGPAGVRVSGSAPGCAGGSLNDCVLILPVADSGDGSNMHIVTYAAFKVTQIDANSHKGTLLGATYTQGVSVAWTPGATGLLVLSLTE